MSVQAMTAVFEMRGLNAAERVVLLAFANYADKQGRNSYPSLGTVADDVELHERTVRSVLRRLEARGYIVREGLHGPIGRRTYTYRIPIEPRAEHPPTPDQTPDQVIRRSVDPISYLDLDLEIDLGSERSGGGTPWVRSWVDPFQLATTFEEVEARRARREAL